ncbi:hypothetical protein D3C72_1207890 [compost metagenome]
MVDLRHRKAEIHKVLLLAQGFLQFGLHIRKMAARNRQFVRPLLGHENPLGIAWILGEILHAERQPAYRPDHDAVDGNEDETGGDKRQDDGDQENIAGISQHRRP